MIKELSKQTLLDQKRFVLQSMNSLEQVAASSQLLCVFREHSWGVTAHVCPSCPECIKLPFFFFNLPALSVILRILSDLLALK